MLRLFFICLCWLFFLALVLFHNVLYVIVVIWVLETFMPGFSHLFCFVDDLDIVLTYVVITGLVTMISFDACCFRLENVLGVLSVLLLCFMFCRVSMVLVFGVASCVF